MKLRKNAFTFIELITVVIIISILSVIGYVSFDWYISKARDSKRASDVSEMKVSLWFYYMENSNFPIPDKWNKALYDWDLLWTQWVMGDNLSKKLSKSVLEKPTDPLSDSEYLYSTTNIQAEYELLAIYESDIILETSANLLNKSNASDTLYPKIEWNFNQIFIKTPNYIVWVPSILNSEIVDSEMTLNDDNIKSQIITWGSNLPSVWILPAETWWIDINLSVYDWSIDRYTDNIEREKIAIVIQDSFDNSVLASQDLYSSIIEKDSVEELVTFANEVVFNNVAKSFDLELQCINKPDYINTTYIYWEPTLQEEEWQNIDSLKPCYYECNTNYTWNSITNNCDANKKIVGCLWTYPTNSIQIDSSYEQTWNWIEWAPTIFWWQNQDDCEYICADWYSWVNCEPNPCLAGTQTINWHSYLLPDLSSWETSNITSEYFSISNWKATYNQTFECSLWDILSIWEENTLTVKECTTDYYASWDNCIAVWDWHYSEDLSIIKKDCSNYPDTASRDYTYTSDGNWTNSCSADLTELCWLDLYETTNWTCALVWNGFYSTIWENSRTSCLNYPDTTSRDYTYTSMWWWTDSCNATYTELCWIDLYETANWTCVAVWTWYYSPTNENSRTACTNNPDTTSRNYTYTSDGNWTNSCTATYTELCWIDLYETANWTCAAVWTWYYSSVNENSRTACTNYPDTTSREYTYTGDGNGTNSCTATYTELCWIDLYETANWTCVAVWTWYYSQVNNNSRITCTNNPDTISRDYIYVGDGNGINSCTVTYTDKCWIDLYETVNWTCIAVWVWYYSPANNNTKYSCTNYPDTTSRNYTYTSDGNWTNSCNATYTVKCWIDLYESWTNCIAVWIWYYSPNLNNTRYSCTNKITNSTYTTDWNWINNCSYSCSLWFHDESWQCVSNTMSCFMENWTWERTWTWSSRWECTVVSCDGSSDTGDLYLPATTTYAWNTYDRWEACVSWNVTRDVLCIRADWLSVDEWHCMLTKPDTTKYCNVYTISTPWWSWSNCSDKVFSNLEPSAGSYTRQIKYYDHNRYYLNGSWTKAEWVTSVSVRACVHQWWTWTLTFTAY